MKNIVYNINNIKFMKTIPNKFYDLVIVDPPYGINVDRKMTGFAKNWNTAQDDKKWDKKPPGKKYFKEIFRISKNQIIFGANYFFKYLDSSKGSAIWDKNNGTTFFADYELIYISHATSSRKFKLNPTQFRNEKRIHKTQKPIKIYKWLLRHYAKPNWKIFDSHVGSGSSRIAAYDMDIYFEGTEIDKDYFLLQENRFNEHKEKDLMNDSLFEKKEIQEYIYKAELF